MRPWACMPRMTIMSAIVADDPYIDNDGDGWPAGPDYEASGATGMLFLLKDPDDTDPAVQPHLTADFWNMLSDVILENLF